mmetsp:Transcript_2707/g.8509  ORF Transcript_2707/g.8509 Transcript_2707/m.8509 type:complete len:92 (-) Transcript_2707:771-1046(-)
MPVFMMAPRADYSINPHSRSCALNCETFAASAVVCITSGSEEMSMIAVLLVRFSNKAVTLWCRTSIPSKCACTLRQLNLNCLMILDIFSKR